MVPYKPYMPTIYTIYQGVPIALIYLFFSLFHLFFIFHSCHSQGFPPAAHLFIFLRRPFWRSFFHFPFLSFSGSKQGAHLFIHFLVAFLALIFPFFIPLIQIVSCKSFIYLFKILLTLSLLIYLFKNERDRIPYLFIYSLSVEPGDFLIYLFKKRFRAYCIKDFH